MKKNWKRVLQKTFKTAISFILVLTLFVSVAITSSASVWFSQHRNDVGTTWSITNLNQLYVPNIGDCSYCSNGLECSNTPIYASLSSYSQGANMLSSPHLRKFGCNVAAAAMALRNMNATTISMQYDVRTLSSGYLSADPFTVMMANTGWQPITYDANTGRFLMLGYTASETPCYVQSWYTIASSFGKTAYTVEFDGDTASHIAYNIDYYLDQNPEGVLVRFQSGSSYHTVLFTASNYTGSRASVLNNIAIESPIAITAQNDYLYVDEAISDIETLHLSPFTRSATSSAYDSMFYCCDPATGQASKGDNVIFTSSYTYGVYGGLSNVIWMRFFD